MSTFRASVESAADISADRKDVWGVLTDPVLLPKLTPLLHRIDADGDTWRWSMTRIAALGASITPTFTEAMTFDEPRRIAFRHDPPAGSRERAGADGHYELRELSGGRSGTHLEIALTLTVELPLPRASAPAVQAVMRRTMRRTGDRFSANLLRHLHAREL